MARAGFLGNAEHNIVLLLKIFQLFLTFIFRLLVLFHSLVPTSQVSSQFILDGTVGARASGVLVNMKHILSFRH